MMLIVGLGNPGRRYKRTRHNIGFRIIDEFQKENNFPKFKLEKKLQAETSKGIVEGREIILAKPQTYMNSSGNAVKSLLGFYKIPSSHLIVAHDELDLPMGEIKLSKDSGSAGHKGVQSIIQEIGTQNFTRVRLGIKPNFEISDYKNFVLKKFSKEEEQTLNRVIKESCYRLVE